MNYSNIIVAILKNVVPVVGREFVRGGKTKLGLYILISAYAAAKFFFGIEIPIQGSEMEAARSLPVAAGVSVGVVLTVVGLGHDLYKKQKAIKSKLFSFIK